MLRFHAGACLGIRDVWAHTACVTQGPEGYRQRPHRELRHPTPPSQPHDGRGHHMRRHSLGRECPLGWGRRELLQAARRHTGPPWKPRTTSGRPYGRPRCSTARRAVRARPTGASAAARWPRSSGNLVEGRPRATGGGRVRALEGERGAGGVHTTLRSRRGNSRRAVPGWWRPGEAATLV